MTSASSAACPSGAAGCWSRASAARTTWPWPAFPASPCPETSRAAGGTSSATSSCRPVEVAADGTVAVPTSAGLGFDVDVAFLESRTESVERLRPPALAAVSRFSAHGLLADLEALVVRESPSDDASAVTALAHDIVERLRAAHVHAETRPCPPRGDAVFATIGEGAGGPLLLGHHDTVWPTGTLAEIPFRVEDGRVRGPGVFDMKAGIAVAMAVLADLARREKPPRVTLLLTPDEELGTGASRPLLLEVARAHREVLVLEPSLAGAAKVARKGTGTFAVTFAGRAAHAGLDPDRGASALLELAHFTLFAAALTRPDTGTTVTPTVGHERGQDQRGARVGATQRGLSRLDEGGGGSGRGGAPRLRASRPAGQRGRGGRIRSATPRADAGRAGAVRAREGHRDRARLRPPRGAGGRSLRREPDRGRGRRPPSTAWVPWATVRMPATSGSWPPTFPAGPSCSPASSDGRG